MAHTEYALKKMPAVDVRNIAAGMGLPIRTVSGKLMGTKDDIIRKILVLQEKGIHHTPKRLVSPAKTKKEKIIMFWDSLSPEMRRELCKREGREKSVKKKDIKKSSKKLKKNSYEHYTSLSAPQLKVEIGKLNLIIPKKGSGKDGRIIKKDLLKVIKKSL